MGEGEDGRRIKVTEGKGGRGIVMREEERRKRGKMKREKKGREVK